MTRTTQKLKGRANRNLEPGMGGGAAVSEAARWRAVVARDTGCDGQFVFAVRTTGIFCKPSCASRRAKRENVAFYETAGAAESAGFRACKRCKPERADAVAPIDTKIAIVARAIETADEPPKLRDLAAMAGLSVYHLQRAFKHATGITPKAYGVAHRNARLRDRLQHTKRVTDAIYEAGFNASSRFYEKQDDVLGMTTKAYKAGGALITLQMAVGQCSLGAILVAATDKGVAAVLLGDDPAVLIDDLVRRFHRATIVPGDRAFEKLVAQVVGMVDRPDRALKLPLDVHGTAFQHQVWLALREIPVGKTISYQELARRIGQPKAVRAVAGACAANPVAIAIPCHRVVRLGGGLSGYRWGVDRKRQLLELEEKTSRGKR